MLEFVNRLRVEEVIFPFTTPLVFPTNFERTMGPLCWVFGIGKAMTDCDLGRDFVEANATQTAHRATEVFVDQIVRQANGFENLSTGIGRNRGDAHLGHDLEYALA
ncbi:unannotated protein [freshwater metagenome]|uniref:Unannotated protein n=1 Tax=freshwater metagenome TaxID=449393 RepID=A0A6J7K342_9ZZZZ